VAGDKPLTDRRAILAGLFGIALPISSKTPRLSLSGRLQQGGFLLGHTAPRAEIHLDGQFQGPASRTGWFVVGFDRDAPAAAALRIVTSTGETLRDLDIAPGVFDVQRIDGLPQDTVTPQGEELLARIAAESVRKRGGFASRVDTEDFRGGFKLPLQKYRLSGHFGGQRILNGVPNTPHYGDDLAAPVGTPIHAPADGLICFAETGLHYEGGLTLIDHGQGLVTAYLHQSRVDVTAGQTVTQGQVIGAVGHEGRATGPHLCWRMKWRGRNLDPMLMVRGRIPA
jgi:murein DD-endopeptidase MepM/ murein hydrolase activator NlpD